MKQMSLTVKLAAGFSLVAMITLAVGFMGWRGISNTAGALSEFGENRFPSLWGLEMMSVGQADVIGAENALLLAGTNDGKETEYQLGLLKRAWESAEKGWKIYEPLPQTREEEGIWKQFVPAWEAWKKDQESITGFIKSGKYEEALGLTKGKGREDLTKSGKLLNDLIELQDRAGKQFLKEAIGDIDRPIRNILFTLGMGTLVAVFLGLYLSFSITRPIKLVAQGLNESADQVASASGQVSSASRQLAEGASRQAASVEETSSSLEEMSSMTKQNADNANQANQLMTGTRETVSRASQSMKKLTDSMGEISRASEETSKIIKTIDEIAFQTNLLALNAAVEAARAGEAGAGFAVVADEVRNLAMRASEAAKNTAALIEGTLKKVNEGSGLVEITEKEFREVALSVVKSSELVGEISAASVEQAQGIEQVNKAVTEMDKVVQQNAATAEESASASEEMHAQAYQMKDFLEELKEIVSGSGGNGAARIAESVNEKLVAVSSANESSGNSPVPRRAIGHTHSQDGNGKAPGKFKKTDPRSEQVIPFDDGDF